MKRIVCGVLGLVALGVVLGVPARADRQLPDLFGPLDGVLSQYPIEWTDAWAPPIPGPPEPNPFWGRGQLGPGAPCMLCGGTGQFEMAGIACPLCNGTGQSGFTTGGGWWQPQPWFQPGPDDGGLGWCPHCHGLGWVRCPGCDGAGTEGVSLPPDPEPDGRVWDR